MSVQIDAPGIVLDTAEEEHDHAKAVATAMRQYGGDFVHALGLALLYADFDNTRRLKAAWPEYWERYSNFARMTEGTAAA
jgi:predicted oxidoreductase (fatty acid repression mutant protein)